MAARDPWRGSGGAFAYLTPDDDEPDSEFAKRVFASDLIDPHDPAMVHICIAAMRLLPYGFDLEDPDIVRRAIEVGSRDYAKYMQEVEESGKPEPTSELYREDHEYVYYMRIGNRVKIGWTRRLESRRATLNPEEVMVIEPGNRMLERLRHQQFADLRVHGEWFQLTGRLIDHIEELRAIQRRAEDRTA